MVVTYGGGVSTDGLQTATNESQRKILSWCVFGFICSRKTLQPLSIGNGINEAKKVQTVGQCISTEMLHPLHCNYYLMQPTK